jgi:spore coat polysaccharide biosynthesis protein SpsF (cytidylyltransferase family)
MVRQPNIFSHFQIEAPIEWKWKGRPFTVDTMEDLIWTRSVVEIAGGVTASIQDIIESANTIE